MRIAIIGTRQPDDAQIAEVKRYVATLSLDDVVVSGCAYGIDELGLCVAKNHGIKTIGCLPWLSYNQDIQLYCDELFVLVDTDKSAYQSVIDYHPTKGKMSQGAFKLHARNYLIVEGCDLVMAYPGPTGGGTLQGIKIAQALGIPVVINSHLT
jgi:predicted Rossmann-fold nucleotide-binding protein